MTSSYTAQNTAERDRLRALVTRLSDQDLARSVGGGWTVTTVLVHLAFWDQNRLFMLKQWLRDGEMPDTGSWEVINDAVAVISRAVPPHAAAQLVVEAAEAIDHALEQLSPDQVAALEAAGKERLLNRSLHRRDHIDQIERALGG
jgi:hypothetical protein